MSTGARERLCALAVVWALALAGCATRPPPDAFVIGNAFSRERLDLPPEEPVVFEATLFDVSNPHAPPAVLGRQRIDPADGPPPYKLRIPFRSVLIEPKGRYVVRARVTVNGFLRFASDAIHPLPKDPAYRRVDVALKRLPLNEATARAEVPLAQTYWKLAEVQSVAVPPAPAGAFTPYLVLQPDGTSVAGSGGCNRFLASYAVDGAQLRFDAITSTLRLCLSTAALEGAFLKALSEVRAYRLEARELVLTGEKGRVLLRLSAAELS